MPVSIPLTDSLLPVSNTITLILQIIIQKYVINHDKIRAQIDENKKKPVKQSNWQAKMQQMQESQKKMQELKNPVNSVNPV